MTTASTPSTEGCSHPLRTVLIGTSLEAESDRVVRTGVAVARAGGARVHLVHASPEVPHLAGPATGRGDDLSAELSAKGHEMLARQIERLGLVDSEIAAEVSAGEPHRVLIDAARRAGADLIVVGATGSGPLAAELLGSTADRVLRKATCPVLLVRGDLAIPPRRVLAPVDLSPLSADAFRAGLRLLGQLASPDAGVEVRALNVVSFFDVLAIRHATAGDFSPEEAERIRTEELARFVREQGCETEFEVRGAIVPGEARFEILRDLDQHPVDLVMLGTHGRGGLDRLMLGSVASTVARKAPSSVLLISPDAAFSESIGQAVIDRTTPAWHAEESVDTAAKEPVTA